MPLVEIAGSFSARLLLGAAEALHSPSRHLSSALQIIGRPCFSAADGRRFARGGAGAGTPSSLVIGTS